MPDDDVGRRQRPRWYDPLVSGPAMEHPSTSSAITPVSSVLRALAARRGWQSHLVAGDLYASWDQVVGSQLAGHTAPLRLQGGVLVLAAESPLWATEVRQLGTAITERVNERLGAGTVTRITVTVRRSKTR